MASGSACGIRQRLWDQATPVASGSACGTRQCLWDQAVCMGLIISVRGNGSCFLGVGNSIAN